MTLPPILPAAGSIRLYVPADLAADASVLLEEGQSRYLGTVMRRAAGDTLRLFNGRDGEWAAAIAESTKRGMRLTVMSQLRPQAPEPDLWLLISVIKREALEWAVEKATELGAAAIFPVVTTRSQPARPSAERLRLIATEAAEQCERLTSPEVHAPQPLDALLRGWPASRRLVAAIERAEDAPPPPKLSSPAALLIGPEGGFDPRELDAMRRLPFLTAASLGPRILRAETAAIVGLALLQRP